MLEMFINILCIYLYRNFFIFTYFEKINMKYKKKWIISLLKAYASELIFSYL